MIRKKEYNARLSIIFIFFAFVFTAITVRLYRLQIAQHALFSRLATQQYSVQVQLPPTRGAILDRSGTTIAYNLERMSAFVLPHQLKDEKETSAYLKKHFSKAHESIKKNPTRKFVWLERGLNQDHYARLLESAPRDVHFIEEEARAYPYPSLAPLLGKTDIDNNGIAGLELAFHDHLQGTPTLCTLEKDGRAVGHYFHKEVTLSGLPGSALQLSVDHQLQYLAAEEVQKFVDKFKAQGGGAIIMDPDTGEILSMVTCPWRNDSGGEIKNINVTEAYELGSVIKIFSTLAALSEEVVTLDEEIDNEGKGTTFGSFEVKNWKDLGGVTSFREALQHSSNVAIAKVTQKLGKDLYYHHLKRLGFGEKTGIEFPGERTGILAHPSKWSKYSVISMSYGYELAASLVQLARALSIIANGGFDVRPTLHVMDGPKHGQRMYRTAVIDQLKEVLESIGSKYGPKGIRSMGKTGTARVAQKGGYSDTRHLYTFGGFVEKGDWRRVIVTFIKEPKRQKLWASQVAAPLFGNIAQRLAVHDKLQNKLV